MNSFLDSTELVDIERLKKEIIVSLKMRKHALNSVVEKWRQRSSISKIDRGLIINSIYKYVLNLPYRYLRPHLPASHIFLAQKGMCTNKAVLFVGLARSVGIPSGFHILRYRKDPHNLVLQKAKNTFRRIGNVTTHVLPVVWYHDRWVNIDCTDDPLLARVAHDYEPPPEWYGQDIWSVDLYLIEADLGIWPSIEELTCRQRNWSERALERMNQAIEILLQDANS